MPATPSRLQQRTPGPRTQQSTRVAGPISHRLRAKVDIVLGLKALGYDARSVHHDRRTLRALVT
jgi:hypothetical protein